jgi:NADH dehydrogenase [ubiquinone] 1 alpha subcomplex assembly factor 7
MPLTEKFKQSIQQNGCLPLESYFNEANHHYYNSKDPFGKHGDFITAPEISQMFGELIGAWCLSLWQQMGSPEFNLVELGPGRGTLMQDALRITKPYDKFHEKLNLFLLEGSQTLRNQQKQRLSDYKPICIANLKELPQRPTIIIANEFFDALGITQLSRHKDGWHENFIHYQNQFLFKQHSSPHPLTDELNQRFPNAEAGDTFEFSPCRQKFMSQIAGHINLNGGAALIIDYGHEKYSLGDTLQALKNHQYTSIWKNPGESDLTSHVCFEELIAAAHDCKIAGPISQRKFLFNLGIAHRAQKLSKSCQEPVKIIEDFERLTAIDQMGLLFKVLAITDTTLMHPPGF